MAERLLHELFSSQKELYGSSFYRDRAPAIIKENLRQDFEMRPYQQEAFGRFQFYWKKFPNRPKGVPTQLLYHMATGRGKTLIMAGLMVYLYTRGYRNFLFFVESTNIIEKTKTKHLFRSSVSLFNPLPSFYPSGAACERGL